MVYWFVLLLPPTPNFNVGNLLWHLRTRFHYTQPHFRLPNRILPNIEIWGRGEFANLIQVGECSHLRTRFHLLTKSRRNLKNKNTKMMSWCRLRPGTGSRLLLPQGPCPEQEGQKERERERVTKRRRKRER